MNWTAIKKLQYKKKENPDPSFVMRNLAPYVKNKSSKSWFLLCPFHSDRKSPSLSVVVSHGYKQPVGFWKCFGCGEKGYWNKLAEALNMETLDGYKMDLTESESLNFDIEPEEEEEPNSDKVNLKLLTPWPIDRSWRGFAGSIVQKYDGMYNKLDPDYPLVFLCKHRNDNKIVGFIRCREQKRKGYKSYLFSKGPWLSNYLWCENKIRDTKRILITEGVRDALAWICRGFTSVAILGTSSGMKSKRKATLLGMGVERIILFMDGDEAGEKAVYGKWENNQLKQEGLKHLLENDFNVKTFKTWFHFPDYDPFKLAKNKNFVSNFKNWLKT